MLTAVRNFILDTLFPVSCLSCGKPDTWLCDGCIARIPPRLEQVCPLCEKRITPGGQTCFSCRRKSPLSGLLAAASYESNILAQAVHYYKYRFIEDFKYPLGEILTKAYLNSRLSLPDLIIPVPLHKRRLRLRGFNQSELLADFLGQNLAPGFEIPVISSLLIRNRYTYPQMRIKDYSKRQKNIENAFSLGREAPTNKLKGKNILLVDDIATTGSTLFECAKILKKSGAKEVFAVVIARQKYKSN